MRKYLYTTLLLALLAQEGVMAQENEGKKGGFFGKIKDTFSTEIKIGFSGMNGKSNQCRA